MKNKPMIKFVLICINFFCIVSYSQNLTISNSGETGTSGTNWSIVGNVLYIGNSGSASINTSVISNHLQYTGDLTINLPEQMNVARSININNTIAYTGSSARTLTFQSANDILFSNAAGITSATASLNIVLRTAKTLGTPDNGYVKMDGINIDTKGGHLWVGGGGVNATWNGLTVGNSVARSWSDGISGISLIGSTVATNGGHLYMSSQSFDTADADGLNYGINIENSIVSSGVGSIYLAGEIFGQYTNGLGMRVEGTTVTSTTGTISMYGYGTDMTGNGNAWRHAISISGASIKSISGNIIVEGQAAFTASINDKEGLIIGGGTAICSQTGNITLRGTNTLESSGQYSNSIRFASANVANSIRIGYDGTNAYSGNITIEGNSVYQRNTNAGAGSIAIQTTGTLTIQPTGTSFTYLRAGDAGTLTFDDDWNFGTTLGGFVYGKTTNTTALTYSNSLTTNGPITMYAGTLTQNGAVSSGGAITFNCSDFALGDGKNLSTSTASDITINANGYFDTSGSTRRTISSANGNIIIHADKDANGSGWISIDYLTLNPGTGATIIRGETVNFTPGSATGPYINGTGSFTFQSSDASFGSAIYTSWFEIDQDNNGIGGLTLGKLGNTTDIQQNTSLTVAGPVNMYGGNIVSSASLTATNSDLSLYASTAVTQTSPIIAAGLSLNGTGTFTLTNTSNNFTTLAGGAVGSLLGTTQIIDVSGGLTIGTVGSTTGLTGSSTIRVETLAGNLTLAGNISTSSTSTDAVILTAAKSTAIGVPTGGDILVSGSPTITMGTGAIAKLFSGYDVTSSGLTALAGGASNVRINYDETTTTYNPVLSANNRYAIYRTALGYGDLNIVSSGGDAEGTTWTYANGVITTTSGTANVMNTVIETKLNSGNLSIEANKVTFSATITGTTSNSLSILSKTHIVNSNATTITTQGGNVLLASNVDDATDNETTANGYILFGSGLTITTNGGNITLGGGNVTGSDYALGTSAYPYEGIRVDNIVNLNSGGGNISMRGKSYAISTTAGAWGVGFWNLATGSINSGTGTVTLDGISQSTGSSHSSALFSNGSLTITSANTTADAIQMIGKSTGNGGEAWGLEAESALSLLATGTGGGITVNSSQQNSANNYDIVIRGEANILAKSGPINLLGGQSGGIANGTIFLASNAYLGSKASSAVPTSSSNVTIQYDLYNFNNIPVKLATSGTLNWKPVSASFGASTYTSWFDWNQNSQTLSGLTIGKSGNVRNVYLNTALTVAGPISVYGNYVEFSGNITSSADGDIFIKSVINGYNPSVYIGAVTINKSAGIGTLTFQANGRVLNYGTLSATGTGLLNVVMWSDYDNTNDDGGVSHMGTISTNGGHAWLGGSNSTSGSYTWNGLTVGDGPSIGSTNYNCNALDLFGPITTGGGDVLLWANSPGCGTSGIVSDGTRLINAGSGDITLITPQTLNTIELTSTGVISLVPNAGSYASALTLGGTLTSGNFSFNTSHYNGLKINSLNNSGLVIGNYTGHLSGGNAVTQGNTSNVTASSALSTKSLEIHGGAIALNENITTSGTNADVLIKATTNINLAASKTITTAAGDVNLWADSDDNSTGYVQLLAGASINSTGGDINLGGGADLTSDYAFGTTSETCPEVLPNTQYISGIHLRQSSSLNSNGGNISLRGQNANTANAAMSFGVSFREVTMNSGIGKIAINGIANGSGSVNAQGVTSWGTLTLRSANTSSDAISITGNALASTGTSSLGVNVVSLFEATGVGGGITITGKSGVATINASVNIGGDILAASGPITISGENMTGAQNNINVASATVIGKKAGTNVTTSSSNVILEGNVIATPAAVSIDCSGTVTVRPFGDSFASTLSWPINNLTLANTVTGLTIGKPSNSANITFANATTINGPITAYGGTITLNANLTTTNSGAISLYTDNALGLSASRTLSAAGAFKYIPRGTAFADNVTYPITNLTSSSTGLTIGKTTNTKDIIISADVTQAANVELYGNNLNINANVTTSAINAAMSLKGNTTIAAGKTITSGGNFTHDGNLLFKSDVNGTAAFGTLGGTFTKVSGVATVERYVPAKRGWRLLTAPLKGSTTNKIPANWQGVNGEGLLLFSPATYQSQTMTGYTTGGGMPNIWKYNSTSNAWSSIPNITTENLFTSTVNNGFLVFATGPSNSTNFATSDAAIVTTLKPKGDLISGDVTHSLTANKYHLIGNPYASPINPVTLRASNPNSKIWMIDPKLGTVGGYFAYDGSNWTPNVPTSSDAYIQSGQGFFVRNNTSDATFTISETHKAIGNSNTWFARTTNTQTTENVDKIRVLLNKKEGNNWILADGILAINHASGNNGLDATDTQKMSNFNENILFKNGTTSLSMEYSALPLVGHVQPMYITGTTVQPYQLQVFTEGYSNATVTPLLQDTQLGTFTPIPTDGSVITHSFTGVAATSTTPDQRFKIVYQSALNSADFNSLWAAVYPNPVNNNIVNIQLKSINDSTNYTLTNLLGQTVQKGKLNALQNTITLPELQEGIYMMTINQEGKRYTSKLQIQN